MMRVIADHLWQSTLFVVAAWLLTLVLRSNAARVRYWVWMAASIKFLIPFSLLTTLGSQFSLRDTAPLAADNALVSVFQQIAEPLATPEIVLRAPQAQAFDFLPMLISIWIVGGLVLLMRWSMSWWRVVAAVREAEPLAMQAPITVKSSAVMSEPGVVGVVSPVLLLPEGIAARLSAEQLQAILAHELCHVRRRDNLTAAVHMLVEVLFWFHPLVWWIGARLVEERERACDEDVVELGNEPQAYAEGILKVCQFYVESKLTCVAGVSGANLKKRVESIMSNRVSAGLGFAKRSLLALCISMAVAAPIGFGLMTAAPKVVQAQQAAGLTPVDNALSIEWVPAGQGPHDDDSIAIWVDRDQSIRNLIAGAYQLQDKRIVDAPSWIDTTRVDSVGRGIRSGSLGIAEHNEVSLLQRRLLAEKVGLKFHRETRQMSVYVLSVAERGRNEKALREDAPRYGGQLVSMSFNTGDPDAFPRSMKGGPMGTVASRLSKVLDSIVLDHTGLLGAYTYNLNEEPTPATLASLLENQLGLKLERATAPVELFVVDSIQQPPSGSSIRVDRPSSTAQRLKLSDGKSEWIVDPTLLRSQFRGEPMNMKFANIDVRELIKTIARVNGANVVFDATIQGQISVDSNAIPWRQVLDEIARFKGGTMWEADGVIFIGAQPGARVAPAFAPMLVGDSASSLIVPAVAKVRASQVRTGLGGMQLKVEGTTLTAANMTLKELVQAAFDPNIAPTYISGGPAWVDNFRFDVTITLASPLRAPDLPIQSRVDATSPMGSQTRTSSGLPGRFRDVDLGGWYASLLREQLRKLLKDEFRLVVRSEQKAAGYKLVALPSGTKLSIANPGGSAAQLREVEDGVVAQNVSTQELSTLLSTRLSMPVMNRTALYGRYNFKLRWPDESRSGDVVRLSASLSEQLGLELTAVIIDALVIDRAEKPSKVSI